MTNKESGPYLPSEENRPSKETFPNGAYKYVFFGRDSTIIMSPVSGSKEHKDLVGLIGRNFDGETDDAGRFFIGWAMSPEEIAKYVAGCQRDADLKQRIFDAEAYRKQLETAFGSTKIKIDPNYGSNTLHYKPNPATRLKFIAKLGQLIPNAEISEEI